MVQFSAGGDPLALNFATNNFQTLYLLALDFSYKKLVLYRMSDSFVATSKKVLHFSLMKAEAAFLAHKIDGTGSEIVVILGCTGGTSFRTGKKTFS